MSDDRLDLSLLLAAVEGAAPVDAVDVLAIELARMVGASAVSLLITNLSGTAVLRMSHVTAGALRSDGRNERVESLPLAGSIYEQVLGSQRPHVVNGDGSQRRVLVPVTERGDGIGILELTLPGDPDGSTLDYLTSAGHALAYVIIASRRHTDVFERAQRDVPFSLAAEIQRRLLPSSYTVEAGPFTLAGWLEPAAQVGGDTFDYAVDREYLYVSITDAMGHANEAALLATLTVGSLRNTRRSTATPAEQANAANDALATTVGDSRFVTGLILRVHLATATVEIVNAGHPVPYLLRDGEIRELDTTRGLPLGLSTDSYEAERFQLAPDDRLVLVTDGFLERNAVAVEVENIIRASARRHPREVVREFTNRLLAVTGGTILDDATVVCVDWFGSDIDREAVGGASRARASIP